MTLFLTSAVEALGFLLVWFDSMNIDKKAPAKLLSHEFECYLIVFEKPCFKSSHPFVIYKNQSVDIQSNMKIAPWSFGILPQEHSRPDSPKM